MNDQTLTLRNEPIIIETAHGLVKILRVPGDRRRIRVIAPDDVRVHSGMKQAKEHAHWLNHREGKVFPVFGVLEAVLEKGELVGLSPPRPLRVNRPSPSDNKLPLAAAQSLYSASSAS